jgi:hypothetical protein
MTVTNSHDLSHDGISMSSKPPPQPGGKVPGKVPVERDIPPSQFKRKAPPPSRIIVAAIVAGFVVSLASAIAPLLLGASKWWLVLSFLMLFVSSIAYQMLRE